MEDKLLEGLSYALPALATGAVAYFMFSSFIKHGTQEKKLELLTQKKKDALLVKLQAYERMLLFCERINPVKLLLRVKPVGSNSQDYLQLLVANIEQEFEHNLVQQLYISDAAWNVIIASKAAVINQLKLFTEDMPDVSTFREQVMIAYGNKEIPTDTAIAFLKSDVKKML